MQYNWWIGAQNTFDRENIDRLSIHIEKNQSKTKKYCWQINFGELTIKCQSVFAIW